MAKKEPEEGREENGYFKKGNKFAQGLSNSGRPPIYDNHQELAQKVSDYIDECDKAKGGRGKGIYTIEGLALYLGFQSRNSLYSNRERSEEMAYIIDRFYLFVTDFNVNKLYWHGSTGGAQFWLKNFGGYKDESTQNQIQTVTTVQPNVIQSNVPLANKEEDIK